MMNLACIVYLLCFIFGNSFFLPKVDVVRSGHKNDKLNTLYEKTPKFLLNGQLHEIDINNELKQSFLSYSMSTILGRALPDVRDGLKPVHRRVLYAMHELGLGPSSAHRKCARIVGEVLGKYHPHGDQSVYDALVRLAQEFVINHPLVLGHGNFGSIDHDPPAAMRYTEAKLSSIAQDILFADIRDSAVDWCNNFDGNEVEPKILPARLPLLLINGASGIAVGMATNIPPHNLGEVVDGLIAVIRNPNITHEDLLSFIPAPDFPTGGLLLGNEGFRRFAEFGQGSMIVRAKMHMEHMSGNEGRSKKNALVITELPYATNKAALLEKIAEMVNEKKLDGIADLRDESDRHGVRVVIELKKDAVPQIVENNLWKYTGLQSSFSGNMLALTDNGTYPQRLSIRSILRHFIKFRFDVIRRRTVNELTLARKRNHIVQGLLQALSRIDEVVDVIQESSSVEMAVCRLMSSDFRFSKDQAESILGMTLRKMTNLEVTKLEAEDAELRIQTKTLETLLLDDNMIFETMINESLALKKQYSTARKSHIVGETVELSAEDLLPNERSVITVTSDGYVKRIPLSIFECQSRGGRGKFSSKLINVEQNVMHFFTCLDHDFVICTTEAGVAYCVRAHQIPLGTRNSRGIPLPSVIPIQSNTAISAIFPLMNFTEHEDLILLTKMGFVKKTRLMNFQNINHRGLKMISLVPGDKLMWVRKCPSNKGEIIITTRHGYGIRFQDSSLRTCARSARGVRAIQLRDSDSIVDMDIVTTDSGHDKYLLVVTNRGFGKKLLLSSIKTQSRLGKGAKIIKFKESFKEDKLATTRICSNNDEVVISSRKGVVIRQSVQAISEQSKIGTGVILQSLDEDDQVLSVDVVDASEQI